MSESQVIHGIPLVWYRVNGWILQAGEPDWLRYQYHILGVVILRTPWIYVGPEGGVST